jgi:hypothetical protein
MRVAGSNAQRGPAFFLQDEEVPFGAQGGHSADFFYDFNSNAYHTIHQTYFARTFNYNVK